MRTDAQRRAMFAKLKGRNKLTTKRDTGKTVKSSKESRSIDKKFQASIMAMLMRNRNKKGPRSFIL